MSHVYRVIFVRASLLAYPQGWVIGAEPGGLIPFYSQRIFSKMNKYAEKLHKNTVIVYRKDNDVLWESVICTGKGRKDG